MVIKCASAVLTAQDTRYMTVDEIAELVRKRRFKAVIGGAKPNEWDDEFWKNIAIDFALEVR